MSSVRRGWLWFVAPVLLIALAGGCGWLHFHGLHADALSDLQAATADLDQREPGWRLADLEKNRRVLADNENGALVVNAARRMLPEKWDDLLGDNDLDEIPPPTQLRPDLADRMRRILAKNAAALAESRKMLRYPAGRYPIVYAPDFVSTLVKDQANSRGVAQLLRLDAILAAQDGNASRALESVRAILHVGRCLEDEPLLISQLIRLALQAIAIEATERTLSQCAATETELAVLQAAFAEEAAGEPFRTGMRGERAGQFENLRHLAEGNVPVTRAIVPQKKADDSWAAWDRVVDLWARPMVDRSNAWMLRYHTRVLKATEIPGGDRYAAIRELGDEPKSLTGYDMIIARLMTPAVDKIADAERRIKTTAYCAIAGLAAERFRLKKGRWPANLNELVQLKLLDRLPDDLFSGQSLRFRRSPDGIVIHSVGADGAYQGDARDRPEELDPRNAPFEFRLWDPAKRRQAPLPKKPDVDEDR